MEKKNSSTFLWFPKGHNRFLISLLLDLSRNGALSKAVPAGKEQQGALETSPAPVRSRGAGGGGSWVPNLPCWALLAAAQLGSSRQACGLGFLIKTALYRGN